MIGDTCGTSAQVLPEYQVDNYNTVPKYYPNTSGGGVAAGVSTADSVAVPALTAIVGVAVVALFL